MEPTKLQRLLSTLSESQHSPVRRGSLHTKHTFEGTHMRSLKGAAKLTALLYEPCAPDLASVHNGQDSVAFSQPEESMRPVNQTVLSWANKSRSFGIQWINIVSQPARATVEGAKEVFVCLFVTRRERTQQCP